MRYIEFPNPMNSPQTKGAILISIHLALFACWVIFHTFLSPVDSFQNQCLRKITSGIHVLSECQTYWIQIRPDIFLGLIWVQTVCKGYQQRMLAEEELTLGNFGLLDWSLHACGSH